MKKYLLLTIAFFATVAIGAINIDVDSLRSPDQTKTWSLPAATDTLLGRNSTDTLTNKTIDGSVNTITNTTASSAIDSSFSIDDSVDPTKKLTFNVDGTTGTLTTIFSNQTANRLITLPDATTTLVGTTGAQTISDKTFVAPILGDATGTSLTLTDKVDAKNLMNQLNSLTDPQVERAATLWGTYADAAGTAPVDGTGNINSPTPVNVTVSNSTSSPLRQTRSLVLVKDAVNRQGQGISQDFTIDTADQGKVLQVSFDYQIASGTYADNDVSFWVYDITNARMIQPAPYLLKNSGIIERMAFEFQSAINSTSYRLIAHVSSTSALAYSLKFDNFSVGQQAKLYGSAITDWKDFSASIAGFSSPPTINIAKYRIVGSNIEVNIRATINSASNNVIRVAMPSGFTLDTGKYSGGGTAVLFSSGGTSSWTAVPVDDSSNALLLMNPSGSGYWGNTVPTTFTATQVLDVQFSVPIVGWSSSQIMSSDASTRVVAASYSISSGVPTSNTQPINFATVLYDSHSAVTTGSSWKFTAPVPGFYRISSVIRLTGTTQNIFLYKNGVSYKTMGSAMTTQNDTQSITVELKAGDYIDVRTTSPDNTTSSTDLTISIERISGPSQIAASETVSALYTGAPPTGTLNNSVNTVTFGTKIKDSHNAYSSGIYTVPVSGTYSISAATYQGATYVSGNQLITYIVIDGTPRYFNTQFTAGAVALAQTQVTVESIPLLAGQQVSIATLNSATSPTYQPSALANFFSITRTGNY